MIGSGVTATSHVIKERDTDRDDESPPRQYLPADPRASPGLN